MRRAMILTLCALVLLGSAARAAEPTALAVPPPSVTVVRAVEREIVERATVTGTLIARDEVLVVPEIEGQRVAEILAEEGDTVKKGQVLARLSREIIEAQVAQNRANIARAEAGIAQARSQIVQAEAAQVEANQALERARALQRTGNTTEAVIEQRVSAARAAEGRLAAARDGLRIAQAELAAAQAQRGDLEWRLSRTEIRAPVAGIVSRRSARVGATASASAEPLFRLISEGEIELEGEVTETQLGRLRPGAAASITVEADRVVEGRVRLVLPEVDRATRLGKVRIALPKGAVTRIGSFSRGTVEIARRTGVAAPLSAVVYGAEGATTLVVVEDKVEQRRVRPGLSAEGYVQIIEGIREGEVLVARAGSFLRHGDLVRPVFAEVARPQGEMR